MTFQFPYLRFNVTNACHLKAVAGGGHSGHDPKIGHFYLYSRFSKFGHLPKIVDQIRGFFAFFLGGIPWH